MLGAAVTGWPQSLDPVLLSSTGVGTFFSQVTKGQCIWSEFEDTACQDLSFLRQISKCLCDLVKNYILSELEKMRSFEISAP